MNRVSNKEYWKDLGLFSAEKVRRMLDVEYISELAIAVLNGTKTKKTSLITITHYMRLISSRKRALNLLSTKSVMNWCKFYLKSRKHVGHISLIFIVCLLFWPKFKTLYRWHKMAAKRFMKNCLPSEMGLPHIKEKAMTIRNLTIQTLCCTLPEFEILLT